MTEVAVAVVLCCCMAVLVNGGCTAPQQDANVDFLDSTNKSVSYNISNIVCLASAGILDEYAFISFVDAKQTIIGGEDGDYLIFFYQNEAECIDGVWMVQSSSAELLPDSHPVLSAGLTTACYACVGPDSEEFSDVADNVTHCLQCSDCDHACSLSDRDTGSYSCCDVYHEEMCIEECPTGFMSNGPGTNCAEECISLACVNGGTLDDSGCKCTCTQFFQGIQCEDCSCYNSGACIIEEGNIQSCKCQSGYSGPLCELCTKECSNGGSLDNNTCTCSCIDGYGGEECRACSELIPSCVHCTTEVEGMVICDECTEGYSVTADNTCSAVVTCPYMCKKFIGAECTSCEEDYQLVNGVCSANTQTVGLNTLTTYASIGVLMLMNIIQLVIIIAQFAVIHKRNKRKEMKSLSQRNRLHLESIHGHMTPADSYEKMSSPRNPGPIYDAVHPEPRPRKDSRSTVIKGGSHYEIIEFCTRDPPTNYASLPLKPIPDEDTVPLADTTSPGAVENMSNIVKQMTDNAATGADNDYVPMSPNLTDGTATYVQMSPKSADTAGYVQMSPKIIDTITHSTSDGEGHVSPKLSDAEENMPKDSAGHVLPMPMAMEDESPKHKDTAEHMLTTPMDTVLLMPNMNTPDQPTPMDTEPKDTAGHEQGFLVSAV